MAQMMYIALTANYPMLFDEEYHLGIIDIYSRQLSPFIASQPPEAAFHGDITRYGSYMFHYIMSFPYRFITLFTIDIQAIVIFLRFICIGFVLAGVAIFRLFLKRTGVSSAISHSAILIFTLIPLVPFALAQLNYDALAFLIIPLLLYFAIRTVETTSNHALWFIGIICLACIGSLVKFTILPIAFGVVLFCSIILYRRYDKRVVKKLVAQFASTSPVTRFLLIFITIISLGLFTERYVVNIIQHKAIEPKCDRLHTREECLQYTVWKRDTTWKEANDAKNVSRDNPIAYTVEYWAPHIFNDFFVVGALVDQTDKTLEIRHLPKGPGSLQASAGNPLLRYGGWVIAIVTIIIFLLARHKIRQKKLLFLILLIFCIYTASLWLRNYTDYLRIGAGTAAQGRYFIALLIPILAIAGLAFSQVFQSIKYRCALFVVFLLLLTQGGGVGNYILYSNQKWYWQEQRQTIVSINSSLRKVIRSFIPL